MERFNLDTWLKDKSRKICTRDGRMVEILKVDAKGNHPIIGVYRFSDTEDMESSWRIDGRKTENGESILDLFFADEEEELTEFENKLLAFALMFSANIEEEKIEYVKEGAKILLDLARKEIEKENTYSGNQKQEWSEDDENNMEELVRQFTFLTQLSYEKLDKEMRNVVEMRDKRLIAWLKSLKHQLWKSIDERSIPSKEFVLNVWMLGELTRPGTGRIFLSETNQNRL